MKLFLFDEFDCLEKDFIKNKIKEMPAERQERCARYRNERDRALCVIAYCLLCSGLKQLYGIEDKAEFSYNMYGKPYLKNYPEIFFSISHTDSLVICAISDTEIGADCEKISRYDEGVAEMICTQKEYIALEKAHCKVEAFFKLWTLKESYIKAVGTGLSFPLKNIEFNLNCSDGRYTLGNYNLTNFIYKKAYSISLCRNGFLEDVFIDIQKF